VRKPSGSDPSQDCAPAVTPEPMVPVQSNLAGVQPEISNNPTNGHEDRVTLAREFAGHERHQPVR